MRFGLRERISVTALVASVTALVAVLVLVGPGLRRRALDHARDRLTAEAHYVEVIRHPELGRIVEEVLQNGQPRTAAVRLPRLGGDYEVSAAPFPGLEGEPHGAVATFEDVSDRRRADEIRRDFAANASHELRTPLTSIRGLVEALEDGGALDDPETAHRFLQRIRANADRMAALISDLLELSRLEGGEQPSTARVRLAADLVDEVTGALADVAAGKRIELRREIAVETVETDPDHLRRILENLVDNALKYTPAGGQLELPQQRCRVDTDAHGRQLEGAVEERMTHEDVAVQPTASVRGRRRPVVTAASSRSRGDGHLSRPAEPHQIRVAGRPLGIAQVRGGRRAVDRP